LDRLGELIGADPAIVAQCRDVYEERANKAAARLDSIAENFPEYVHEVQRQTVQRIGLDTEVAAIEQLAAVGGIPESASRATRGEVDEAKRELARRSSLSALRTSPEELLKRVPMFESLEEQDFRRVVAKLVPRTRLAGEIIIRQGERGDTLFLVARGVVAVLVSDDGGPPARVASLHAGDFFGEMALLTEEPRSATVQAATDCRLFELSRSDVYELCEACDGVREALERAAAERRRT
jgi:CPA1 family monovalent cation:H+ antiporter